MKGFYLLGGVAAFSIIAAGAFAAQPAPGPGPQGPGGPRFEGRPPAMGQMGRHFGHGGVRLSPEERKKVLTERFQRIDANRDGRVTFEEFRAYREARRLERQRQAFGRLTGGKDSLTLEDFTSLADRGGRRGGRMGPMRGGPDRF